MSHHRNASSDDLYRRASSSAVLNAVTLGHKTCGVSSLSGDWFPSFDNYFPRLVLRRFHSRTYLQVAPASRYDPAGGRSTRCRGRKKTPTSRSAPKTRRSSVKPKKGMSITNNNAATVKIPFQLPPPTSEMLSWNDFPCKLPTANLSAILKQ